jgi:hypothetical protein
MRIAKAMHYILKKLFRFKQFEDKIQAVHVSPVLQSYILLVNENGSVSMVTADLGRVVAKSEPIKRYVVGY